MTRLFNDPAHFTDEAITGFVAANRRWVRPVPGGVQRLGEPRCGSVDDLIGEVMARGVETVCVGDGALRYRDQISTVIRCDFAEQFLAHPSAAPLVQLAHARALREEWVNPWELQPLYLRAPDARINWSTRASATRSQT